MKAINLTLLAPVVLLAIGLSSCRKDEAPAPATGIQRDSLSLKALKHVSANPKKTLSDSLLAYYPFSGNANDESGHGYNGIVFGATLTAGKSGGKNSAYSFNGTSDYIGLPFSYGDDTTSLSIYARVRRGSSGILWSSADFYRVDAAEINISSDSTSINVSMDWQKLVSIFPKPRDEFGSAGGSLTVKSSDKWDDIVINFQRPVLTIYINGKVVSTTTQTIWPRLTGGSIWGRGFSIGVRTAMVYWTGFFNGTIDELRFYTRPLTTDEIDYLYKH